MTDGFGSINWWGFSPAIDLLSKAQYVLKDCTSCINILLVGCGDCRQILKTISRRKRHKNISINFFIVESSLELYARQLLLMSLSLENPLQIGLQEKAELFLEIYGNSLIRSQSLEYVKKISGELIKFVTESEAQQKRFSIFNLSSLKFKERDMLEGIFKFWRNQDKNGQSFEISKCWDLRVRNYLGSRYDSIPNVFDWDYSMKLCEKGADIINSKHYSNWRTNGIAFDIREADYCVPNCTLASGMVFKHNGEKIFRRGYWGDILVSPYITFGIESTEKSFFKLANNVHTHTAQDVTLYNVTSTFHEMITGKEYSLPKVESSDKEQKATLKEIIEEEEKDSSLDKLGSDVKTEADPSIINHDKLVTIENVTVNFLPTNSVDNLVKKNCYQKFFDIGFFSNSMVHHLTPDIEPCFNNKSLLILETSKFMLELKKEQHAEFLTKIVSIGRNANFSPFENPDEDSNFVFFKKNV